MDNHPQRSGAYLNSPQVWDPGENKGREIPERETSFNLSLRSHYLRPNCPSGWVRLRTPLTQTISLHCGNSTKALSNVLQTLRAQDVCMCDAGQFYLRHPAFERGTGVLERWKSLMPGNIGGLPFTSLLKANFLFTTLICGPSLNFLCQVGRDSLPPKVGDNTGYFIGHRHKKNGATGEMAQWLRAPDALPEDLA